MPDTRFAHELYPGPSEGETRPLADEIPYLYAWALTHLIGDRL